MQVVSGVRHAGNVLGLFTTDLPEWGAADVGRALGLSRSHAHRLLTTLSQIGLLDRLVPSGRFRLSWSWLEYASVLWKSDRLVTSGVPIMRQLSSVYGWEPKLAVWRQGAVLSFQLGAEPTVSRHNFDECPTVGIVLIAGLPDDEFEAAISGLGTKTGLPPREEFESYLSHVRSEGLLVRTDAHHANGQCAVAAITGERGRIVAALAVHTRHRLHIPGQSVAAPLMRASMLLSRSLRRRPQPSSVVTGSVIQQSP